MDTLDCVLLAGSIEILIFWVEELFLINIPNKKGTVMNNAAFHKGKAMQKMIKDAGHTLPPSFSSDLNLIEK
ncbi:hypothetical protein [Holospora curviuscula]|uniref:Tc1-like transposase DDE domain-containing protein n=1 Tax=Holospora curviuscula TaxID=1082868 RepID=A0A2S5RI06_9PROT|nr:hypothetical protein [Holospora curviuscula]PPE06964.1 hypothetical protein HCUR_00028 [Holospora curviuscula]